MTIIKKLDEAVIAKIAAGEVIERPLSVVKELVENSIDAGATAITVDLREGGRSLIRVTDNGCGMHPEDAVLAMERHATSKINNAEDLFHIHTLGFRGEALASIAAVSEMVLTTRTAEDQEACRLKVSAGVILSKDAAANPQGTTIEVQNLFFNTPARKKYMRSIPQELHVITELIERLALVYPKIMFRLKHQDTLVLQTPGSGNPMDSNIAVYGKDAAKEFLEVKGDSNGIIVSGFLAKPTLTKADKDHISIYINKRYVKNNIITNAVLDAYHTLLSIQRYPVAILHVEMPSEQVDVNAHPTKREVRLSHEHLVYEAVFDAVKKTLDAHLLIPKATLSEKETLFPFRVEEPKQRYSIPQGKQVLLEDISPTTEGTEKIPAFHVLGQLNKTYIIAQDKEGMMIIDQHVAHERVLYEQFMELYFRKAIQTQHLLEPAVLELTAAERVLAETNSGLLKELGFELEPFGQDSYMVRTLPLIMGRQLHVEAVFDILGELGQNGKSTSQDALKESILTRMSCRAAVKAGDELSLAQIVKLIEGLHTAKRPFTCPHGRPILISLPFDEIEKRFKRK